MKKYSSAAVFVVVTVMVILASMVLWQNNKKSGDITYTSFQDMWNNNQIESITVNIDNDTVEGVTKDNEKFSSYIPLDVINKLVTTNPKNDVSVVFNPPSSTTKWISAIGPSLLVLLGCFFLITIFTQQAKGGGSGAMGFGKNRAQMITPDKQKYTFKDVAGADEEKEEFAEIVDFLKKPSKYNDMGARIPRGVLLVGPPGTGKTLLAKAIAGEAGVPFFSISGSDFVEMYVGVGASRVRSLFEDAKKNSPCIIFIDEIDAVGRQRGAGVGGSHDEKEQTLNQLLVEMDGFTTNEGIIVVAATNRPDILDPALLRPGRFDRQITVGRPDVKGREEILKVHTRNKPLDEDVDLNVLAKMTSGFSGAELENLANEAALLAVRKNEKRVSMTDLEESITRVIAGTEKKSRVITDHDKRLTAYHEAGHAIVMRLLPNCDPVHEISIIPRGMAGGYTMNLPKEDSSYVSKSKLKDEMAGLLGGRVAENLVMGDISTGAKNDIDRASSIAKKMVMQYGMSDEIGTISYGTDSDEVFLGRDLGKQRDFSEELGSKIDREVKKFIDEAYERATLLLKQNMSKLDAVAKELIDKEKIDGKLFEEIFEAN